MATVKLDPAKGIQIPNLTTTERNAISSPETGAIIWNTTTSEINQYNGSAWEITYTDTSVAGITSSADATAITIDSNEQVGIANTSPNSYDAEAKNLVVGSGTGHQGITIVAGTSSKSKIHFADGTGSAAYQGMLHYDHSNDRFTMATATADRIKIDSDGIKFGSDTAAANALDDYEEGYYTVSISGSTSGSFNMAGNDTLAYTKIGRLVTIQGYIGAQSGSVGGNVRISLPFAPTNLGIDDQTYNFPSVMIQNTGNTISGQKYLFLQADGSAYLYKVADDGSAGYISNSSVDGNFEIGVSFTYISG